MSELDVEGEVVPGGDACVIADAQSRHPTLETERAGELQDLAWSSSERDMRARDPAGILWHTLYLSGISLFRNHMTRHSQIDLSQEEAHKSLLSVPPA